LLRTINSTGRICKRRYRWCLPKKKSRRGGEEKGVAFCLEKMREGKRRRLMRIFIKIHSVVFSQKEGRGLHAMPGNRKTWAPCRSHNYRRKKKREEGPPSTANLDREEGKKEDSASPHLLGGERRGQESAFNEKKKKKKKERKGRCVLLRR